MRIGIAGCGRIAERGYVPAALDVDGVEIAGLADPDEGRRRRCLELCARGGESQVAALASVDELLRSTPLDLLVVATPAAHHLALAEEAAAAGVRSLVEKPPALDLVEARALAELDPQPLLAFNRRFLQGEELLAAVPEEGWVELDLELRFRRDSWGAHEAHDEALLDAGIHLIDLACFLTDAHPIAVRHAEIEHERATLELELARGRARIRCATDRGHREEVSIRARSGKLLVHSRWGGIRTRLGRVTGRPDPLLLSLQHQLGTLRDAAPQLQHPLHPAEVGGAGVGGRRRSSYLASAGDGIAVMSVVEAARRSAQLNGAEVTVSHVETQA